MLVVFGGLPGVGKTTIAQHVARDCQATYLRIDTIEQSIRPDASLRIDTAVVNAIDAATLIVAHIKAKQTQI